MTTQVQFNAFNFKSSQVRVIVDPTNEPWFCANDVCDILGYSNPRDAISKHCKEKGVAKRDTLTNRGNQEMTFINEPNLYRLIIKSRKPEAEPFEAWVFEEVLPQIRKTRKYQLEPKQLALPEPEKKFTFEFTEYELQLLPWIWFIALRGTETCRMIYPAMETIGSKFSGAIYGQAYEYKHTIREVHKLLKRLTANFQYDYESNWRVLKHLNNYNPKSNNYQVI
ncbi:BRO family protein [Rodentibacter caecimuris]|uniref:BRO family protein n=1 Tax=Rodentibacter caecimuris TaxID=1796644 RepID=UPI002248B3AC|nr:BRO family protein [Rodentibacter heylii]MCX2960339.1 BRO family protein [Rodentibacter heylii]